MEDIFDSELGRKILALTKASFKVSDLISDLVLREKIKHQVLEVYKTFLIDSKNQSLLLREIDVLDHYFYLGGHLNLIKEEHLKQLRNGFLVFKSHIVLTLHQNQKSRLANDTFESPNSAPTIEKTTKIAGKKTVDAASQIDSGLTERHQKLLARFPDKETSLQLSDFIALFPKLSDRTIRNELSYLIELGKITRRGMGSGSYYKVK